MNIGDVIIANGVKYTITSGNYKCYSDRWTLGYWDVMDRKGWLNGLTILRNGVMRLGIR